jgi:hypothetical protein
LDKPRSVHCWIERPCDWKTGKIGVFDTAGNV